jgi:hypothetical protein
MSETLTNISGQNNAGQATISLTIPAGGSATQWECIFSSMELTADTQEFDASTFCSEPQEETEPGNTIYTMSLVGLLKKGRAIIATLLANPRLAPGTFTFATGCSIAGTWNFNNTIARRVANQNAILSTRCRSSGTVTLAWA